MESSNALALLLAITGLGACATSEASSRQGPPLDVLQVARDVRALGIREADEAALIRIEPLALGVIAGPAAVVILEGRAFPRRAVYYRVGADWRLFWFDGAPIDQDFPYPAVRARVGDEDNARDLATDLLRLFEDPDPIYAFLVERREDIPLDRKNSDFLRDLVAAGLDETQRRERMLGKVSFPLAAPQGQSGQLTFYSWSYFGGHLKKWDVRIRDEAVIVKKIETLASEVGSYDLFP